MEDLTSLILLLYELDFLNDQKNTLLKNKVLGQ